MSLTRRISTPSSRYVLRRQAERGWRMFAHKAFILVCALSTAYLVFLSYHSRSRAGLAWLAWVPFLWGVTKIRRFWSAVFYGWVTAFLFYSGLLYWVYYTCVHGGGMSAVLSAAAWLGLCAVLSLQYACFGGCCYYLKRTGALFPLLTACGFITFEWLHQTVAFYGIGFPWMMWGYTQWNMPQYLQIASFTGVYGVSFLLILVSALVAWALAVGRLKRSLIFAVAAVAVWLGASYWGKARLPVDDLTVVRPGARIQAALVQPNIDQYKKWDKQFEEEILDTIRSFGDTLQDKDVHLTVWPESVTPGELTQEPYLSVMEDVAERTVSYQVIGSTLMQPDKQYVGAYLMSPDSETLQAYRKVKLVPFGEYIPLEKVVRRLFPQVTVLGALGGFTAGARQQPLLNMGDVSLGTTLCYESIFPQLWRTQNKQGARFFVNLTNDAWFFNTAAPHQHLAANVLRAVETGRMVLRAANTGISAVIDPFGRITQKTDLFVPGLLQTQVPLESAGKVTFYTTYGNWFVWLSALLFFTVLIFTIVFLYE